MAATDAPPLFLIGPTATSAELVNYRYINGYYVVDQPGRRGRASDRREAPDHRADLPHQATGAKAMTALPPDSPLGGPPRGAQAGGPAAPKASASSALQAASHFPVTRWNRRYLLAGGVGPWRPWSPLAFYLGFRRRCHRRRPRRRTLQSQNGSGCDPDHAIELADQAIAKGYGDLTVQPRLARRATSDLPPAGNGFFPARRARSRRHGRSIRPCNRPRQQARGRARLAQPLFRRPRPSGVAPSLRPAPIGAFARLRLPAQTGGRQLAGRNPRRNADARGRSAGQRPGRRSGTFAANRQGRTIISSSP